MADYLMHHYKGKYRMVANLDQHTHDVPREPDGTIADGYDDTYIVCAHGGQIYHVGGSVLEAYIPSVKRGHNILTVLAEQGFTPLSVYDTDTETLFKFKAKDIDTIAKAMGVQIKGASTSPYSTKRLPKVDVKLPEQIQEEYKAIIALVPKANYLMLHRLTQKFLNTKVQRQLPKGVAVKADMKQKQMARLPKEYIYTIGLWDAYIKYLLGHKTVLFD